MQPDRRGTTRRMLLWRAAQLAGATFAALGLPRVHAAAEAEAPAATGPAAGEAAQRAARGQALAVTAVFGSGRRRGISETAGERLLARLEQGGASIQRFYLTELRYRGCQGCLRCRTTSNGCVQRDDLSAVLASIRSCDALVLASSTYFGEISSQAKGLLDRMFSFRRVEGSAKEQSRTRFAPGKKLALVLAQGNPSPTLYASIGPRYAGILSSEFGFVDAGLVRCVAIQNTFDVGEDPDVDDAIQAVAGRLLAGLPAAGAVERAQ